MQVGLKQCCWLVAVSVAVLACTIGYGFSRQDETAGDGKRHQLIAERLRVLSARVKVAEQRLVTGHIQFSEVVCARQDLLQASFEYASSPAERIAILEEQLKNSKSAEEFGLAMKTNGDVTEIEYLETVSDRLAIEIKLEKERASL